jgi:hypothetical protein
VTRPDIIGYPSPLGIRIAKYSEAASTVDVKWIDYARQYDMNPMQYIVYTVCR